MIPKVVPSSLKLVFVCGEKYEKSCRLKRGFISKAFIYYMFRTHEKKGVHSKYLLHNVQ